MDGNYLEEFDESTLGDTTPFENEEMDLVIHSIMFWTKETKVSLREQMAVQRACTILQFKKQPREMKRRHSKQVHLGERKNEVAVLKVQRNGANSRKTRS